MKLRLTEKSKDIIKNMESAIRNQEKVAQELHLLRIRFSHQLYRDLIVVLKNNTGKEFLLEITGSYQLRTPIHYIALPGFAPQEKTIKFHKIYVGRLSETPIQGEQAIYPNYLENREISLFKAFEIDLGIGGKKHPIETFQVFIQKTSHRMEPSWNFESLFSNLLPESWRDKNGTRMELQFGRGDIVRWLAGKSTDTIPMEIRKEIFALDIMK